jgi:hypothetical protein
MSSRRDGDGDRDGELRLTWEPVSMAIAAVVVVAVDSGAVMAFLPSPDRLVRSDDRPSDLAVARPWLSL